MEKPGIELATPGLQDIGLSHTLWRLIGWDSSWCPSIRTHEWTLVGYFKFLKFIVFKNQ